MKNKFADQAYLDVDMFGGDMDVDIRCHSSKIVKIRKQQKCTFDTKAHKIAPGNLARFDKAIVDGEWGSCYSCISCLDKWLIEVEGAEPEESR